VPRLHQPTVRAHDQAERVLFHQGAHLGQEIDEFTGLFVAAEGNLVAFVAVGEYLLAVGNTPSEAAEELKVSRGRISQLRRALDIAWQQCQSG